MCSSTGAVVARAPVWHLGLALPARLPRARAVAALAPFRHLGISLPARLPRARVLATPFPLRHLGNSLPVVPWLRLIHASPRLHLCTSPDSWAASRSIWSSASRGSSPFSHRSIWGTPCRWSRTPFSFTPVLGFTCVPLRTPGLRRIHAGPRLQAVPRRNHHRGFSCVPCRRSHLGFSCVALRIPTLWIASATPGYAIVVRQPSLRLPARIPNTRLRFGSPMQRHATRQCQSDHHYAFWIGYPITGSASGRLCNARLRDNAGATIDTPSGSVTRYSAPLRVGYTTPGASLALSLSSFPTYPVNSDLEEYRHSCDPCPRQLLACAVVRRAVWLTTLAARVPNTYSICGAIPLCHRWGSFLPLSSASVFGVIVSSPRPRGRHRCQPNWRPWRRRGHWAARGRRRGRRCAVVPTVFVIAAAA